MNIETRMIVTVVTCLAANLSRVEEVDDDVDYPAAVLAHVPNTCLALQELVLVQHGTEVVIAGAQE